jgi:DNA-binding transcriptional LysR family regulator
MRSPAHSAASRRLLSLAPNAVARRLATKRWGATMLTLYQLENFIVVAKHRNITRAARELHVSQSAVSQQIERLEENLRVTLIRKKRRGIELTEPGVSVRTKCERILSRVNALKKINGPRTDTEALDCGVQTNGSLESEILRRRSAAHAWPKNSDRRREVRKQKMNRKGPGVA